MTSAATRLAASGPIALSFLDPHGPIAAAERDRLIVVVLLLLIVVLPVLVLTPVFAWRYRYKGSTAPYRPKWAFSWALEFLVWGVPIAVVIVIAIGLWRSTRTLDPYRPIASAEPPLRVAVVGYDWKWLFVYPDLHIASIGQLAFPAGRPLALELTSDTVMQSLLIPALGSQIYAMPGMVTRLNLLASAPGDFRGENNLFNGKGFYMQKFTATAMSAAAFAAWSQQVRARGLPLSAKVYAAIDSRSTLSDMRKALGEGWNPDGALYFSAVPSDLLQRVVRSFHGGSTAIVAPGRDGPR